MFTWNKEDPLIRDQTVSRLFLVNDKNKEAERRRRHFGSFVANSRIFPANVVDIGLGDSWIFLPRMETKCRRN